MQRKTKIRILSAAALLAVLAGTGATYAYLSGVTDQKTNTFTMGTGISGKTEEPGWDEKAAVNFVPGKIITKDPEITNTSAESSDPVYVAAQIRYLVKDASGNWVETTYAELDRFINILTERDSSLAAGFNEAAWAFSPDFTAAYYKDALPSGHTTEKLFSAVEIDPLALTPEQIKSVEDGGILQFDQTRYALRDEKGNVTGYTYRSYEMKDFQITVTGYLCQTMGFSDARTAMTAAFPDIFQ